MSTIWFLISLQNFNETEKVILIQGLFFSLYPGRLKSHERYPKLVLCFVRCFHQTDQRFKMPLKNVFINHGRPVFHDWGQGHQCLIHILWIWRFGSLEKTIYDIFCLGTLRERQEVYLPSIPVGNRSLGNHQWVHFWRKASSSTKPQRSQKASISISVPRRLFQQETRNRPIRFLLRFLMWVIDSSLKLDQNWSLIFPFLLKVMQKIMHNKVMEDVWSVLYERSTSKFLEPFHDFVTSLDKCHSLWGQSFLGSQHSQPWES